MSYEGGEVSLVLVFVGCAACAARLKLKWHPEAERGDYVVVFFTVHLPSGPPRKGGGMRIWDEMRVFVFWGSCWIWILGWSWSHFFSDIFGDVSCLSRVLIFESVDASDLKPWIETYKRKEKLNETGMMGYIWGHRETFLSSIAFVTYVCIAFSVLEYIHVIDFCISKCLST